MIKALKKRWNVRGKEDFVKNLFGKEKQCCNDGADF